MAKPKILHISKFCSPHVGGVESFLLDFDRATRDVFSTSFFSFNDSANNVSEKINGEEVFRAGTFGSIHSQPFSLFLFRKMKNWIDEVNPDIIVFHYPNPLMSFTLRKILQIEPKKKLVVFWHGDITKKTLLTIPANLDSLFLCRRANLIIAETENYAKSSPILKKFLDKVIYVPDPISIPSAVSQDDGLFHKIKERYKGKVVCFAFGRHVKWKGFQELIKVFRGLNDDYVLLLGGAGPYTKKLKKLAGNQSNITFLGLIPKADLQVYLQASDIFCFPSIGRQESFGLTLCQAMASSLPCVLFNNHGSGANYLAVNGETGIVVPYEDTKAFRQAIVSLACDKKMAKAFGISGRQRIMSLLSFDIFKRNINDALLGLLKSGDGKGIYP